MHGIRKSLVFRTIQRFVNRKFKKTDQIIDIHSGVDYWAGDTLGEETSISSGIDPVM